MNNKKEMEIQTIHTNNFKTLIEILKEIIPETNIEFKFDKNQKGNNGMKILAQDPGKTVMIFVTLNAENFQKFYCEKRKVLGVNLVCFHRLIKSMDKDDCLTLYMDKDDINNLGIDIDNENKNKKDSYKLKLMDLDNEEINMKTIKFDVGITMNGSEFHKMCREMNQISDTLEIKCTKNQVLFSCDGETANRTTTYSVNNESDNSIGIKWEEGVEEPHIIRKLYELKNFVLFSKCGGLCGEIQILMKKEDFPLFIVYRIASFGQVILCVVPYQSDDDMQSEESDTEYENSEEYESETENELN